MKHLISIVSLLLLAMAPPQLIHTEPSFKTIEVSSNSLNRIERKARNAAVRVSKLTGGHGSGSIVRYKDLQLILTAQHIADGTLGERYLLIHGGERRAGILLYSDELNDIAILIPQQPFEQAEPMEYSPITDLVEVGTEITYSAFPAAHSLMTYRGRVAGYETSPAGATQILLHTYGYFGCSGSVIYNSTGKIIGILWGIDIGRDVPVEDMIWVSPIQNLNIDLALRGFCELNNNEPRACR